ncbi:NtaA/DmoA family FMN-dependent monooxygenase [Frondihabitans australicus]|uniref:FMN-dependent oxidoreductase (Nitrilotriacetate monooxygenase family) n=1 Tax=Frondihabitans australicus TaxID=386892 RepID=A0A495ICR9_9MICO|nr:NtaA/DmoA family FMN-dependent monooxygenase [Frondihabitans australicus]RKR73430.1 FMN-dependent oxidoreductase (nitrilotriacetate monooxygenase family) [Frondihabitans australicus]
MSADPFRLGWFANLTAPNWNTAFRGNDPVENFFSGRFHVDMVRAMEKACMDFIMIEDSLMVPNVLGGDMEMELKHAVYAPKMDPVVTASMLAEATERIGIIATASTTFYHPWHLARQFATLNNITQGRIGWNIVTSSEDLAAQNYGLDVLPEHDLRYEMAAEFVDVAKKLWASWEPDAIVADPETGYYADHTKVHEVNHEGRFYKSRGPLNLPAGPGGRPVFCQAGSSPKGRDFAAANSDVILTIPNGVEGAKEYRADVRRRAEAMGRDPDEIKIFPVIQPILAETMELAREKRDRWFADKQHAMELQMAHMAGTMEIDFLQFDPDQPLPDDVTTNGHQGQLDIWRKVLGGRTIREGMSAMRIETVPLVGTPDSVAAEMDEFMQEVGGDGFLIFGQPVSREYINDITNGLVPALQRRGVVRTSYAHTTLRENLRSF